MKENFLIIFFLNYSSFSYIIYLKLIKKIVPRPEPPETKKIYGEGLGVKFCFIPPFWVGILKHSPKGRGFTKFGRIPCGAE